MNLIVDLVINQCVVYFVGMYVCMEARYFVNRFWWSMTFYCRPVSGLRTSLVMEFLVRDTQSEDAGYAVSIETANYF